MRSEPDWYGNVQHWVERAEKAEARVTEQEHQMELGYARVAELEAMLRTARYYIDPEAAPKTLAAIDAVLAKGREG